MVLLSMSLPDAFMSGWRQAGRSPHHIGMLRWLHSFLHGRTMAALSRRDFDKLAAAFWKLEIISSCLWEHRQHDRMQMTSTLV
jgi:hypothetical protein